MLRVIGATCHPNILACFGTESAYAENIDMMTTALASLCVLDNVNEVNDLRFVESHQVFLLSAVIYVKPGAQENVNIAVRV